MTYHYIGIDPGMEGAIAILDEQGELVELEDLPIVDRHIDTFSLAQLFHDSQARRCTIEDLILMPENGKVGVQHAGVNYGRILSILEIHCIPFQTIRPTKWKKHFRLAKQDKEASRAKARQLFPTAELHLKKHHNRAEALLIAFYGYQWWRAEV